ncbi:MAG: MarR family transcriptional regulator [Oceanospirillaceae bacterium]|nr:MarR family transcriptional regulator [Oceanospirillaceae bacterium]
MNDSTDLEYAHAVSSIHNRLFFRIFQVASTLERQSQKELGISSVQWSVLGALSRPKADDGMLFTDLVEYLGVSRQNLDGVLKRLERDAQVTRQADPADRRAKRVFLTDKGRKDWANLQEKIYEFYNQSLKGFSFDDKVAFVHYLNRVQQQMKEIDLS